jgi:hypothetical protein
MQSIEDLRSTVGKIVVLAVKWKSCDLNLILAAAWQH